MTPGEVIEQLANRAYQIGIDPLDLTAAVVEVLAEEVFGLNLTSRDPRAVVLGRRIAGSLLELGWQLPGRTETP
jgi:hypothetical protein